MLLGLGVLFMGVSPRIWMFIICTSLLPHHSSLPNSHNVKALGIYALGSGLGLFMLSLLTTKTFKHLDEQHTAQLYSAVVLVETVGEVVGIPILSSTMIAGISIGGYGVGLPFVIEPYDLITYLLWARLGLWAWLARRFKRVGLLAVSLSQSAARLFTLATRNGKDNSMKLWVGVNTSIGKQYK